MKQCKRCGEPDAEPEHIDAKEWRSIHPDETEPPKSDPRKSDK